MKAPDRSPPAQAARFEALLIESARADAAPEASRRRVAERLGIGALVGGAQAPKAAPHDGAARTDAPRDAAPRSTTSEGALSLSKPAALSGLGGIGAAGVLLWALTGPSRALDAPTAPPAPTPRESASEPAAHTATPSLEAPLLADEAALVPDGSEREDDDATPSSLATEQKELPPAAPRPSAVRRAEATPRPVKARRAKPSTASTRGERTSDGDLLEEVRALDRARHELSRERAGAALVALDDYARRFPRGQLAREALALREKVTSERVISDASTERNPVLGTSKAPR